MMGSVQTRPNVRVHAESFKCTETSGFRMFTGCTTQYRNGHMLFPRQRHVLWAEPRGMAVHDG